MGECAWSGVTVTHSWKSAILLMILGGRKVSSASISASMAPKVSDPVLANISELESSLMQRYSSTYQGPSVSFKLRYSCSIAYTRYRRPRMSFKAFSECLKP